jgi:hypothetical protein
MSRPKQFLRIGARLFTVAAEERVGMVFQRLSVETDPLPSRRLPFQVADPRRFIVLCSFRAALN